jgi:hypothetical protein
MGEWWLQGRAARQRWSRCLRQTPVRIQAGGRTCRVASAPIQCNARACMFACVCGPLQHSPRLRRTWYESFHGSSGKGTLFFLQIMDPTDTNSPHKHTPHNALGRVARAYPLTHLVRIVPRELWERHSPVDPGAVWPRLQVGEPPLPAELRLAPRSPQSHHLLHQAVDRRPLLGFPLGRAALGDGGEQACWRVQLWL